MKKSEICVLIGSVDRGDSDVGERLWLSAAKTDPRHPVQTNQSPLYIAKSYIVHSAHFCTLHLAKEETKSVLAKNWPSTCLELRVKISGVVHIQA